jgi:hypothetical protein
MARYGQGGASRILIGFDLKALKGARIKAAQLRLDLVEASGLASVQVAVSGVQGKWSEAAATWSNQPERTATYGIQDSGNGKGTATWDMTSLLGQTVGAGGTLDGIALSGPVVGASGPYGRTFASREAGAGADGPKLIVDYVPGQAGAASPGAGAKPPGEAAPGATAVKAGVIGAAVLAGVVALGAAFRRRSRPG